MAIILIYRNEEHRLEEKKLTVRQAFDRLNLSPETHLAVKEGELITENEVLKDGDVVNIIAVISGG